MQLVIQPQKITITAVDNELALLVSLGRGLESRLVMHIIASAHMNTSGSTTFVLTLYSMCDPVAPPTLCGSPTVIENVGFAACSTLTLGRLDVRIGLGWAAATGGGALGALP